MASPMTISGARCMRNTMGKSDLATYNHKPAYFSGLGIAVPTVVGGATPALERA